MARRDEIWTNRAGGYIETLAPFGFDILINGEDKYLNFKTLSGSTGYGFRDNLGIIEWKNEGGAWSPFGSSSSSWDKPFGDAVFTYDVDGNVSTKTVGLTALVFTYDIDGNVDTITDGTNIKTFTYDVDGNVDTIIYT